MGQTSSDAAVACKNCVKGKFGEMTLKDGGVCIDCPSGYFQPEEKGDTVCAACPIGYATELDDDVNKDKNKKQNHVPGGRSATIPFLSFFFFGLLENMK